MTSSHPVGTEQASGPAAGPAAAPSAPTLLIVEPLVSVRAPLERLLEKRGVSVLLSGTGREALRLLERQPVEAALLSLRLPDMDGLALCRRVSTPGEALPGRCRVLMLAPLDDLPLQEAEQLSERCRAAGALGTLPLPVEAEQLFSLTERVLGLPLRPLAAPVGGRWPQLLRALRVGQAGVLGLTLLDAAGELLMQSGELLAPQLLPTHLQQLRSFLAPSPELGPLHSLQLEYGDGGRVLLLLPLSVELEGQPGELERCLLICLLQDAGQASLVRYRLQQRASPLERGRDQPDARC